MDAENLRALATDGVVVVDGGVVVLERDHPPDAGSWVLPGGMVERGERARTACAREVREEVGLAVRPLSLVGLYDAPGRDPRGNVSVAHLCVPTGSGDPAPGREARAVEVVPFADLDERPLGFDHRRIVEDALASSHSRPGG